MMIERRPGHSIDVQDVRAAVLEQTGFDLAFEFEEL